MKELLWPSRVRDREKQHHTSSYPFSLQDSLATNDVAPYPVVSACSATKARSCMLHLNPLNSILVAVESINNVQSESVVSNARLVRG